MSTTVSAIAIPPVSAEFIRVLSGVFQPFEIKAGFDRDLAMQSAGEQKVVEWIKHHAAVGRSVTGDPNAIRQTMSTGAIVKIGE